MNREDFERLLLLYGSRLDRWPADEAAAARALTGRDAAARALLDEAQALDALMAEAVVAGPAGSAMTGQLLEHVRRGAGWRRLLRSRIGRLAFAGAPFTAAAGFAAGFFVGGLAPMLDETMLLVIAGGDAGMWLLP